MFGQVGRLRTIKVLGFGFRFADLKSQGFDLGGLAQVRFLSLSQHRHWLLHRHKLNSYFRLVWTSSRASLIASGHWAAPSCPQRGSKFHQGLGPRAYGNQTNSLSANKSPSCCLLSMCSANRRKWILDKECVAGNLHMSLL